MEFPVLGLIVPGDKLSALIHRCHETDVNFPSHDVRRDCGCRMHSTLQAAVQRAGYGARGCTVESMQKISLEPILTAVPS